jgi:fructose-bisphosphate aldolase class I
MTDLAAVAADLVSIGRGILAADESIGTMSARLEAEGIAASPDARRDYRELLVTSPGLSATVSGVILCGETFDQRTAAGVPFPEACRELGVLPGIKVDAGTSPLPGGNGATITEGLDSLGKRLAEYAAAGAAFAKWRAVIAIGTSDAWAIEANAHALARYAELCQEHGIVPIVEPEVLATGTHDIDACAVTTEQTLDAVFSQLSRANVALNAIVLKPNMITSGLDAAPEDADAVAAVTLAVLNGYVSEDVPGIAFLSGGQSNVDACTNLAAMNELAGSDAPWRLTYSFGRALVSDALRAWGGNPSQAADAQLVLLANSARAAAATQPADPDQADMVSA